MFPTSFFPSFLVGITAQDAHVAMDLVALADSLAKIVGCQVAEPVILLDTAFADGLKNYGEPEKCGSPGSFFGTFLRGNQARPNIEKIRGDGCGSRWQATLGRCLRRQAR